MITEASLICIISFNFCQTCAAFKALFKLDFIKLHRVVFMRNLKTKLTNIYKG